MPPPAPFGTTLWSTVLLARDSEGTSRRGALDRLCARYWTPLYAYLLRRGLAREDAQDAVQGFFAYFLEKGLLDEVDPARGRFRRYLLAVLERWLANERRTASAAKRAFDFDRADRRLAFDPAAAPDEAFRRTWALEVLREAMSRLKREYQELGRSRRFEAAASQLAAGARPDTEEIARRLGVTPADVHRIVYEARRRLQGLIREVLRDTVGSDLEVDDEVRELFGKI
ncbi:MAG TPA: sigma-70 family RNA polymerase sigma factor [Planctomycetota bacterium]